MEDSADKLPHYEGTCCIAERSKRKPQRSLEGRVSSRYIMNLASCIMHRVLLCILHPVVTARGYGVKDEIKLTKAMLAKI